MNTLSYIISITVAWLVLGVLNVLVYTKYLYRERKAFELPELAVTFVIGISLPVLVGIRALHDFKTYLSDAVPTMLSKANIKIKPSKAKIKSDALEELQGSYIKVLDGTNIEFKAASPFHTGCVVHITEIEPQTYEGQEDTYRKIHGDLVQGDVPSRISKRGYTYLDEVLVGIANEYIKFLSEEEMLILSIK